MDNISSLSTDELRQQLANYDIVVDERTLSKKREIYIKKLNHAIARSKPPNASPTRGRTRKQASPARPAQNPSPARTRSGKNTVVEERNRSPSKGRTTARSTRQSSFRNQIDLAPPSYDQAANGSTPVTSSSPFQRQSVFNTPSDSPLYRYGIRQRNSPPRQQTPDRQAENKKLSPLDVTLIVAFVFVVLFMYKASKLDFQSTGGVRQLKNEGIKRSSDDDLLICGETLKAPCFPKDVIRHCLPIMEYVRAALDTAFLHESCNAATVDTFAGLPFDRTLEAAKNLAAGKNIPSPDKKALMNLFLANPHWRVVVDKRGSDIYLKTKDVKIPFQCTLEKKFWIGVEFLGRLILFLVGFAVCSFVGFLIIRFVGRKIQRKRFLKEKSKQLAEQIIDAVRCQYEAHLAEGPSSTPPMGGGGGRIPPYVVINHLYGVLLPLDERVSLLPAWKAAVEIVATTESRIRKEIRSVDGETQGVWLWTASLAPLPSPSKKGVDPADVSSSRRRKQSVAEQAGGDFFSVSAATSSSFVGSEVAESSTLTATNKALTPCLKVRGLIPPHVARQAWNLESRLRVFEAADDAGSCGREKIVEWFVRMLNDGKVAVYVRCSDTPSAGLLAVSLRRLNSGVTVHYVRSEKFQAQFH